MAASQQHKVDNQPLATLVTIRPLSIHGNIGTFFGDGMSFLTSTSFSGKKIPPPYGTILEIGQVGGYS